MTPRACARALLALVLVAAIGESVSAQISTGTISGAITIAADGGPAVGAEVTITAAATGRAQQTQSSDGGHFAQPWLAPGTYVVRARSGALGAAPVTVQVNSGSTTVVDVALVPNAPSEVVDVGAPASRREQHEVGGWIDRRQLDWQPVNGRNVLDTAKTMPGVGGPLRANGRVFVSMLGAGLQTIPRVAFNRITFDGANIETPGTLGTLFQVSPDMVEQVHVTTSNFDVGVGLATGGAIDLVSRAGGSSYRAGAFSQYRDERWSTATRAGAAALSDPPLRRQQTGVNLSGPIGRAPVFFALTLERHDQRDALPAASADPMLSGLGGIFSLPKSETLVNLRADTTLWDRHRVFGRYTLDSGASTEPFDATAALPSGLAMRPLRAQQGLGSITSDAGAGVVNLLRVSVLATRQRTQPLTIDECPAPCLGFGPYRIVVGDLSLGAPGTARNNGRRVEIADTIAWMRGSHLWRIGATLELTRHSVFTLESDPARIVVWAPSAARLRDPSLPLPPAITTLNDVLALPLRSFTTSVGPGQVLQRDFQPQRRFSSVRISAGDEWRLSPRLSVSGGIAWSYEPGVLNDDLPRPAWLAPLVDGRDLAAPAVFSNVAGTISAAWNVSGDGRTLVRAGVGRYAESISRANQLNLATERALLSPVGTNRLIVSGSNLLWNGRQLNFPAPTTFTAADLIAILPQIRATLEQTLRLDTRDFSTVNIDISKEGSNLVDPAYETPRAWHASMGVDHRLGTRLTVGADVVWKRFAHTFINGIDFNHFGATGGPVIPLCPANRDDIAAPCSNGSLFFDTTSGRARYAGVLARVQHLGARHSMIVAYAYGRFSGSNGTGRGTTENADGRVFGFNNDDWFENDGPLPTDVRHVLNVTGRTALPFGFDASINFSAAGRAPFTAYVAGIDFNGDGTTNDLLPGTRVNQFNRGLDRDDLVRLVESYNTTHAGRSFNGVVAPRVTLPDTFRFNDTFSVVDVRISRVFRASQRGQVTAFVDVFNVLNTKNDLGFSGDLTDRAAFGQPRRRVGQAFGSGGPRAAQIGARVRF